MPSTSRTIAARSAQSNSKGNHGTRPNTQSHTLPTGIQSTPGGQGMGPEPKNSAIMGARLSRPAGPGSRATGDHTCPNPEESAAQASIRLSKATERGASFQRQLMDFCQGQNTMSLDITLDAESWVWIANAANIRKETPSEVVSFALQNHLGLVEIANGEWD